MKPAIETYAGPDQKSVQIFRDDTGTRVPDAVSYLMGTIHSQSGMQETSSAVMRMLRWTDSLKKQAQRESRILPV